MNSGVLAGGIASTWRAPRQWRTVAVHGVLWGLVASLLESVALPLRGTDWADFWRLLFSIAPGWSVVGIGIASWIALAGARLTRPAFLATSIIGVALAMSALWSGIYAIVAAAGRTTGIAAIFPQGTDAFGSFMYQAWVVAFYGGLYMCAWALNHRAERMRQLLGRAGIARMRTETLLGEAELAALRGHIDSRFLLRVMIEVERRFTSTPEDADRLIRMLVRFLRLAMPGVRNGRATLNGELGLARAYEDLWRELEPQRAEWTFTVPDGLPHIAFPPLLLLATLDSLNAASSIAFHGRVAVVDGDGEVRIRIDDDQCARDGWLAPELAYRIRVGLSTLYGNEWTLMLREHADSAAPALELIVHTGHLTHCSTVDG